MSSPTVLVAVSILAAAIAYAGSQLGGGEMIVYAPPTEGGGVFQLAGGMVRWERWSSGWLFAVPGAAFAANWTQILGVVPLNFAYVDVASIREDT